MTGRVTESPVDPVQWAEAVTTSDGTDHANGPYSALCVTTAGTYKITTLMDNDVSVYLAAGVLHPIWVRRVWSTGSAATTGIVGFRTRRPGQ